MFIVVNGLPRPLPQPQTLAALLQQIAPPAPFAVARNGDFVPRTTYTDCTLTPGDEIDIVHPASGG